MQGMHLISTGFYRLQGSWVRGQGLRVITIIVIDPQPQARRLKRMTATGTSTLNPETLNP